jgi:aryl-alcohol dehydrogenase-like predicted oxidoreductase
VERRSLGRSGLRLPVIGMLAGKAFDVRGKEAQDARTSLVRKAIESDIDFFATAPDYGEAERILAASLVGSRRRATVLTMISSADCATAQRDIDRSLHYFDGWIDLYLLDWRVASRRKLDTLVRMRAAREARVIGAFCRTLGQAELALAAVEDGSLDVLAVSAPLLALPEIDWAIERARGSGAGVLTFLPDVRAEASTLDGIPVKPELAARFNVSSWRDVLLKLALGDTRITSAIVPIARATELRTTLEVARPPWFGPSERALIRGLETTST